jgi:hypothetical protein
MQNKAFSQKNIYLQNTKEREAAPIPPSPPALPPTVERDPVLDD